MKQIAKSGQNILARFSLGGGLIAAVAVAGLTGCKIQTNFAGEVEVEDINDELLLYKEAITYRPNLITSMHYRSEVPDSIPYQPPQAQIQVATSPPREFLAHNQEELHMYLKNRYVKMLYKSSVCSAETTMDREDLIELVEALREARRRDRGAGDLQADGQESQSMALGAPLAQVALAAQIAPVAHRTLQVIRERGPILNFQLVESWGREWEGISPNDISSNSGSGGVQSAQQVQISPGTVGHSRHITVYDANEVIGAINYLIAEVLKREPCEKVQSLLSALSYSMSEKNEGEGTFKHVALNLRFSTTGEAEVQGKVILENRDEKCRNEINTRVSNQELIALANEIEIYKTDIICQAMIYPGYNFSQLLTLHRKDGSTETGGFTCMESERVRNHERFFRLLSAEIEKQITCLKDVFPSGN